MTVFKGKMRLGRSTSDFPKTLLTQGNVRGTVCGGLSLSAPEDRVIRFNKYNCSILGASLSSLAIKTPLFSVGDVGDVLLIRELRSHMPCGQESKKYKKQTQYFKLIKL